MKLDDIIAQQAAYYGMTVEQFKAFSKRMAEQQEREEKQND